MCIHLQKRNSVYYFRRVVPDDLRGFIGRDEWVYSLRTKDREEAKRRRDKEAVRVNGLIEEARRHMGRWRGCVGGCRCQ